MSENNNRDQGRRRALAILGALVIVLALALILMSFTTVMADTTTATSDPIEADSVVVDLRTNGDLEVVATDDTEVTVVTRIRDPFGWVSEEQRLEDGTLVLESRCAGQWIWFLNRCRVDYVVRVPADTEVSGSGRNGEIDVVGLQANIDLTTTNGEIIVEDIEGMVQLESNNGEIGVSRVMGDVTLATSNGEIRVVDSTALRMVQATSNNGEIVVSNTSGDLDLETDNGRIDVDNVDATVVTASSDNGRIRLSLSSAPEQVTAETSNGAIEMVLPADAPAYAVDIDTGNGSTDTGDLVIDSTSPFSIVATSGNGDITIGTG